MILTTGIYAISRCLVPRFIGGLNFESNEELGGDGHLWTDTNLSLQLYNSMKFRWYSCGEDR